MHKSMNIDVKEPKKLITFNGT